MLRRLFMSPVTPASLVGEFLLYVTANISEANADNHRKRLRRFLASYGDTPLHELRPLHADEYLLSLKRAGLKADTIYGYIESVKAFEAFWRQRYPKESPEQPFISHIKVKRPKPRPGDKVPSDAAVNSLVTAASIMLHGSPLEVRNGTIFYTFLETGLRRRELTTLTIASLRLDRPLLATDEYGNEFTIYETAPIDGKTNEEPVTYTEAMANIFRRWLAVRPPLDHDHLFVSLGNCHRFDRPDNEPPVCKCCVCRWWGRPLTVNAVEKIMESLSTAAGLAQTVYPHAIRHFFGQRAVDTNNLEVARQLLRHENITTTTRYAHQDSLRRYRGAARASFLVGTVDSGNQSRNGRGQL